MPSPLADLVLGILAHDDPGHVDHPNLQLHHDLLASEPTVADDIQPLIAAE